MTNPERQLQALVDDVIEAALAWEIHTNPRPGPPDRLLRRAVQELAAFLEGPGRAEPGV